MSDLIATAVEKIAEHENQAAFHHSEAVRLKNWVNDADRLAGNEPRYKDVDFTAPMSPINVAAALRSPAAKTWQVGDFLGKPFAAAVKSVLAARYEIASKPSPASVDEIREALLQGTFDFGAANADQQKQGIRISLGKNSVAFVKLPNTDLFGLVEWYPGLKKAAKSSTKGTDKDSPALSTEGAVEETAAPAAAPEAA
jgi:hypothetical protein